jgi:hypothetical protein
MRVNWDRLPIYPVLLVASFLLAAFFDADVSPFAALRVSVIVLGAAVLITIAAVLVVGPTWGGIAAGALCLVARAGHPIHVAAALLLIPLIAVAWLLSRRLWPKVELLRHPNGALNAVALLLLMVTLVGAVADGSAGRVDLGVSAGPHSLATNEMLVDKQLPDIYLILLDGYPRADTLARLFDFDNSPFLDALRTRGFDVAANSTSNYMYTELTLASLFHMRYVDEIPERVDVAIPFGVSLRSTINNNPVWTELRSRGYAIATALSPWENVALRSADVVCGDAPNEYELFLARTTLAGRVLLTANPDFEADSHRAGIQDAFTCLNEMSQPTIKPKLVFAHVGSPHLPIVFGAAGQAASHDLFGSTASDSIAPPMDFVKGYVDQVRYLNTRVLAALDTLVRRGDHPVVIVMSDHGSELRLDWGNALNSDIRERFGTLFAARTPGHPNLFSCDVTPVEIFPTVMNTYLGDHKAFPERRFFASTKQDMLTLTELPSDAVADKASTGCSES